MPKDILQCIGKLEGIDIAKTELNVSIDDKLGEAKDFATKMESISET